MSFISHMDFCVILNTTYLYKTTFYASLMQFVLYNGEYLV